MDGVHSTVLCQGHRDDLEGIGEGPHGILLQRRTLRGRGVAHKLEGVVPPDKLDFYHLATIYQNSIGIQLMCNTMQYLIRSLVDGQGTCNLRGATSIHDAVVSDQVTDHAQSIVECTLSFLDDLIGAKRKKKCKK